MKTLATVSISLAAILTLATALTPAKGSRELVVSAAASMAEVLTALKPEAERALGFPLLLNFGASGALRFQIEHGAGVDVFISASAGHMDRLEAAGRIAPGTRSELVTNALILVGEGGAEAPSSLSALEGLLASAERIAIGDPDSVPAGAYAAMALKGLGLYERVRQKLVLGSNVRQVLAYVATGSAPLAIVFATDLASGAAGGRVGRLYEFPDKLFAGPIAYPAAIVASSPREREAEEFIGFLAGASARAAFTNAGFGLP